MKIHFIIHSIILIFFYGTYAQSETKADDTASRPSEGPLLIDSLNMVSFNLRKSQKKEAIQLARNALAKSRDINYEAGMYHARLNLGIHYTNLNELDSAYQYLRIAEEYYRGSGSREEGLAIYYMANMYSQLRDFERSESYFTRAREIFKASGNIEYSSNVTNGLGILHGRQSNYIKALGFFIEAYELKLSLNQSADAELNNIAIVYRYMEEYDEALKFAVRSLEQSEENMDSTGIYKSQDTIGDILYDMGEPDSALWYYEQACQIASKLGDDTGIYSAVHEISLILRDRKEYDEVLRNYKNVIRLMDERSTVREVSLIEIAKTYMVLEMYDSAIYFADQALGSAQDHHSIEKARTSCELLKEAYVSAGELNKGLFYSNLEAKYRDTLEMDNEAAQFTSLRIQMETLGQEKKIELLEKQAKIDSLIYGRLLTMVIVVGILFWLLVAFLVWRNHIRQSIQKLETSNLKQEIAQSKNELHQQTLHMVHKNNGFIMIEEEIKKMQKKGETNFQKLLNIISLSRSAEKDWENFNNYFNKVNPGFEENILTQFPQLSLGEIRLASLIKMKLTNQEIATILNIEAKSVRMNKYRFKRKLGLEEQQDLFEFINTF